MSRQQQQLLAEIEADIKRLWERIERELDRKYAEEQQADFLTEQLPF